MSDYGVDVSLRSSWCEFAAFFRLTSTKNGHLEWNSGRQILYATSIHSVMTRYTHPRNIQGQRRRSPLEVKEDIARLCLHLVPYDGLGDASDKVLGKLFWSNGWLVLTPILRELNFSILPRMGVMSRGRHPKAATAEIFMEDLASRFSHRVQLITEGHRTYLTAIDGAFEKDIDTLC